LGEGALDVISGIPSNVLANAVTFAFLPRSHDSASGTTGTNVTTGINVNIRIDDAPAVVTSTSAVVVSSRAAGVLFTATATDRVGGSTRSNGATRGAVPVLVVAPLAVSLRSRPYFGY